MSEQLGTNAWHGEPLLKETVVTEALAHEAADRVLQFNDMRRAGVASGHWGPGEDGVYRGCSIGCIGHTWAKIDIAQMFGFPVELVCMQETVFERCTREYSKTWTSRLTRAIPAGADTTTIVPQLEFLRENPGYNFEALGDKMIALVSALAPSPHTPADQPHARKYADIAVLAKVKGD